MSRITLATVVTLFRIVLIPFMVLVYCLPFRWAHFCSSMVFVLASLSDWLDGYLARRYNQYSPLGEFLDPVADKLIVSTALILLSGSRAVAFVTLPAMVIVGREIAISALREWMAKLGQMNVVAVNRTGKAKTMLQMIAISFLLAYYPPYAPWMYQIGIVLLYGAALLTLWSMVLYIKASWKLIRA